MYYQDRIPLPGPQVFNQTKFRFDHLAVQAVESFAGGADISPVANGNCRKTRKHNPDQDNVETNPKHSHKNLLRSRASESSTYQCPEALHLIPLDVGKADRLMPSVPSRSGCIL